MPKAGRGAVLGRRLSNKLQESGGSHAGKRTSLSYCTPIFTLSRLVQSHQPSVSPGVPFSSGVMSLAESLSRHSTPSTPQPQSRHKKRKLAHSPAGSTPRKEKLPATLLPALSSSGNINECLGPAGISNTGRRKQRSAANWEELLPSLIYPFMAVIPKLQIGSSGNPLGLRKRSSLLCIWM